MPETEFPRTQDKDRKERGIQLVIFVVVGLGFSAVFIYLNVELVYSVTNQIRAESYPTVMGDILASDAKVSKGSADLMIEYRYVVGNQQYTSKRARY